MDCVWFQASKRWAETMSSDGMKPRISIWEISRVPAEHKRLIQNLPHHSSVGRASDCSGFADIRVSLVRFRVVRLRAMPVIYLLQNGKGHYLFGIFMNFGKGLLGFENFSFFPRPLGALDEVKVSGRNKQSDSSYHLLMPYQSNKRDFPTFVYYPYRI